MSTGNPHVTHSPGGTRTSTKPKVGHIVAGRSSAYDGPVWLFLRNYMAAHQGVPPAVRDIQAGVGASSTSAVQAALRRLERQGLIQRGRYGRARTIQIVGARFVLPEEAELLP